MIISISGTPGVGKTYIAKRLAKITGIEHFDLNKHIKENELYESYDKKDKTYDVDVKDLKKDIDLLFKGKLSKNTAMEKLVNKTFKTNEILKKIPKAKDSVIIDSHLSHYLNCDYCIIVRSDLKTISKRLKERKYSKDKIKDNIESEIFEVCLEEARKLKRKIIIVQN